MTKLSLIELKKLVDAAVEEHGNIEVEVETKIQCNLFVSKGCVDKRIQGDKVFLMKCF